MPTDPASDDALTPRLDKTAVSIVPLSQADDENAYWWSRTPEERMQHLEYLRRLNYGEAATGRMVKVLEIVQKPWG
ncbi:MAG: hypothetical protein SH850_23400 [Planctomycetaceae bacterium]|nr:hypothetical protein [Planctomycetaceae bacterium]